MATFIQYELDDGSTFLIQQKGDVVDEEDIIKSSSKKKNVIERADEKFEKALEGVMKQAGVLKQKLKDLRADEVEVKFGLVTTGKAGTFAVASVEIEANYEVTLKWSNKDEQINSEKDRTQPDKNTK